MPTTKKKESEASEMADLKAEVASMKRILERWEAGGGTSTQAKSAMKKRLSDKEAELTHEQGESEEEDEDVEDSLEEEKQAVTDYAKRHDKARSPEVKAAFKHNLKDEKEHKQRLAKLVK